MSDCYVVYTLIQGGDFVSAEFKIIEVFLSEESAYNFVVEKHKEYVESFKQLDNQGHLEFVAGDFLHKIGIVKKTLKI